MDPQDLDIWNLKRILVGDVPWIFLLEVIIRIFFIYFLLVASMRLMGKRMAATLNRNELAAMVSLAAAIGIPMQQPDKGLLPATIIAIIVVGIQRGFAMWMLRNKKFEAATQGDVSVIVEDGCLNLDEMEKTGFSRERIFAQLRSESIKNLGAVQRLYLEANGGFSVLMDPKPRPGLPITPSWDNDFTYFQKKVKGKFACKSCGNVRESGSVNPNKPCRRCGNDSWEVATEGK